MAYEQANDKMSITQMVAEAMRVVMQVTAAASVESSTRQSMGPKVGGPLMKQPTFNWDTEDKFNELKNFKL